MLFSMMTMVVLAASPVSMEFDGSLKDGLKQLAQKSGLNLVVLGDLDERVQLNLPSVEGEDALETIAQAYGLEVTRSEKNAKLWVVKKKAQTIVPLQPAPSPESAQEAIEKAQEAADEAREKEQEAAEAAREAAQDKAEAARDAKDDAERNRVSTGGPVTVEKSSHVETAVAYGGPVIVEENAVVEGDAVAFGGDVVLKKNSVVEGDAVSFGGSVVREAGAVVHGQSVSMGGSGFGTTVARNLVKSQRATRTEENESATEAPSPSGVGRGIASFLLQFAVFFGLGFVLMMFAPQRMKTLEETIANEPGKNGLAGFLALVASLPLTLMLCITLIGIPVAAFMWIGVGLMVPVAVAVLANTLGARLPTGHMRKTQALVLAVGLLALMLIANVPVLGVLLAIAAGCISFGAIIRTRFGQPRRGTPMLDPMQSPAML
jgi:hypothetical protein